MIVPVLVDVFDPLRSLLWCAGSKIQSKLRLPMDKFTKAKKLICAKCVVLRNSPRDVEFADPLICRADTIVPIIGRGKVSSKADEWGVKIPSHRDHIGIHSIDVISRNQ